jgi:poly-gamma-glutamate synthesis protein (capsule biosynthesis protein)
VTWADAEYLREFCADLKALRPQVDVLVASCHWGLGREPLQYMTDIGRAAIDAGADVVMGHGPHYSLPVELHNGRPIFYGLGNLCFKTGHLGRKHTNWLGMLVELTIDQGKCAGISFRFVRQNDQYESVLRGPAEEAEALADLAARSAKIGAKLVAEGDCVRVMG